jgi:enoyl-CoA hydratase
MQKERVEMTDEPEILFERRGHAGLITLNRPKALNALTLAMVREMHPQLAEWVRDPQIAHVVIRAGGEKAFCAGGDIRQLHDWGKAGDRRIRDFYREEYRLNTFIKRYPKPYVALIDGIVMGGGVGVSVHGSLRAAGERIAFAMPETGIGLFPDVGGTYFLPRLPGMLGTYLALTGARLRLADAHWAGIVTHALDPGRFGEMVEVLAEAEDIDAAISAAAVNPGPPSLPEFMPVIDRCFSAGTVEEVVERLDAESGTHAEWAREAAATIGGKSPTSLKIALRQMRLGATLDFEDCMRAEFRIVNRVVGGTEFYEGVRAVIVDKDNRPRWQPAKLTDVSDADIDAYFAPLGDEELVPL